MKVDAGRGRGSGRGERIGAEVAGWKSGKEHHDPGRGRAGGAAHGGAAGGERAGRGGADGCKDLSASPPTSTSAHSPAAVVTDVSEPAAGVAVGGDGTASLVASVASADSGLVHHAASAGMDKQTDVDGWMVG